MTASTTLVAMVKFAVDAALVGQRSATELAAFAFVFPLLFLAISAGRGIYTGSAAVFSNGGGLEDFLVKSRPLVGALLFSVAIGVTAGAIFILALGHYTQAVGAEPYADNLKAYFNVWVLSVPLMFISANTFAIARNMGFVTVAGSFTLVANVAGVAASLLLIPDGAFGLGLGIEGAAYSTLLTSLISTCLSLLFIGKRVLWVEKPTWWAEMARTAKSITAIAVPVFLSNLMLFLFMAATTGAIALFGVDALAALGAIGRIEQILLAFQIAFTTVGIATFSHLFSGNDWHRALLHLRRLAGLMLGAGIISWLLSAALSGVIAGVMTSTADSVSVTSFYLQFLTISICFQGFFLLGVTLLNLMGCARRALLWCFSNYCAIGPILLVVSVNGSDVRHSLIALAATNVGFGIFALVRTHSLLKKKAEELQVGMGAAFGGESDVAMVDRT